MAAADADAEAAMPEEAFANASAYGSDGQAGAQFSGVVTDAAGAPLAGVGVAMCGSACWPAWTDESGRFLYESLPVERYALDVRGESVAGRTLTSVVLPVALTAGSQTLGTPLRLHEAELVAGWHGNSPVRFAGISLTPNGPVDVAALARRGRRARRRRPRHHRRRADAARGVAGVSGWPPVKCAIGRSPCGRCCHSGSRSADR